MATFKLKLGRVKKNKRYSILLDIHHRNENTAITLPYDVLSSEWNKRKKRIKIYKKDNYEIKEYKQQVNEELDSWKSRTNTVIKDLTKRQLLKEVNVKRIAQYIKDYNPECPNAGGKGDFNQYWDSIAQQHPKSYERYRYAHKVLIRFHIQYSGSDDIRFRDISTTYVRDFLAFLKISSYDCIMQNGKRVSREIKPSTIKTYANTIKAVLKRAVVDGKIIGSVLQPFEDTKYPKNDASVGFTLTIEQLRELLHYPFPTKNMCQARDMFILSFCFQGMNFKDIYSFTNSGFEMCKVGNTTKYIRAKTGHNVQFTITDYHDDILQLADPYLCLNKQNKVTRMYRADEKYLFDFYYRYSTYGDSYRAIAKAIRKIREIMKYPQSFTFYTARDSWATIMSRDYSIGQENVDLGLGHSSSSLAAIHYIQKDFDKVANSHTNAIGRLFGHIEDSKQP